VTKIEAHREAICLLLHAKYTSFYNISKTKNITKTPITSQKLIGIYTKVINPPKTQAQKKIHQSPKNTKLEFLLKP
jgi:hypothetical protein